MRIKEIFLKFLKENYNSELFELREKDEHCLIIDSERLELFDPDFADLLILSPKKVFESIDDCVDEYDPLLGGYKINFRFKNIPNIFKFKEIGSDLIGQFIGFDAIIEDVGNVVPVVKKGVFECKGCMKLHEVEQSFGKLVYPNVCSECGGKMFKFLSEESEYRDSQRLRVRGWDTNFKLDVFLERDLCSYDDFVRGKLMRFFGVLDVVDDRLVLSCNYFERDVEEWMYLYEWYEVDNKGIVDLVDEGRRNSKEYREWVESVINRDGVCQCCEGEKYLEVHHIFGYNDFRDLRLSLDNGVVLCKWCHGKFHSYFGKKTNAVDLLSFVRRFGSRE